MVGPFLLAVEKSKSNIPAATHRVNRTPAPDCSQQAGFLRLGELKI